MNMHEEIEALKKRVNDLEHIKRKNKLLIMGLVAAVILSPLFAASIMNGNFGVGISSPSARLHVQETTAANAFRVDDAASDTTPFIIDQNGNVGIKKTSPSNALDVAGDISLDQYIRHNGDNSYFGFGGNDIIAMVINGTVRFYAHSSGNVAIGALTAPVNQLDVEGNMAIGSGYAGSSSAPTNGLIVQGNTGLGTTSIPSGRRLAVNGSISSSVLGTYCGVTASSYTGATVGGYTGAKSKCETTCGNTNAHMCTPHEYVVSMQLGIVSASSPVGILAAGMAIDQGGNISYDCVGFTTNTGFKVLSTYGFNPCNSAQPIMCCL